MRLEVFSEKRWVKNVNEHIATAEGRTTKAPNRVILRNLLSKCGVHYYTLLHLIYMIP